jgi:hypothetical protein
MNKNTLNKWTEYDKLYKEKLWLETQLTNLYKNITNANSPDAIYLMKQTIWSISSRLVIVNSDIRDKKMYLKI